MSGDELPFPKKRLQYKLSYFLVMRWLLSLVKSQFLRNFHLFQFTFWELMGSLVQERSYFRQ